MIIKSCYIENFGKFREQSFEFKSGLNIIKEDNGWGKSTLAIFIKAMFYGMIYTTARKELAERTKYMPWQGGNYGGYLVFEVDGVIGVKEYKVVRYFGKKDTEDTFELYDMSTNKISTDYTNNLGEELFGIVAESFERSIFITLDGKLPMIQDSINAKLNNLIDNTDDINNFENAYERLAKLSKEIKPQKGSGKKLGEVEERIIELNKEIKKCEEAEIQMNALDERIKESMAEKADLEARAYELEVKMRDAVKIAKKQEYQNMLNKKEEKTKELNEISEKFGGQIPSLEDVEKNINRAAKLQELFVKANSYKENMLSNNEIEEYELLEDKYADCNVDLEKLDSGMDAYNRANDLKTKIESESSRIEYVKQMKSISEANRKKGVSPTLLKIGVLLFLLGVGLLFVSKLVGIALVAVGILCELLGFMLKKENKNLPDTSDADELKRIEEKIKAMQDERDKLEHEYMSLIKEINPFADLSNIPRALSDINKEFSTYELKKKNYEKYKENLRECDNIKTQTAQLEEELNIFIKQFDFFKKDSYNEVMREIRDTHRDYINKKIDCIPLENEIKKFEVENDISEFANLPEEVESLENQQERYRHIAEAIKMTVDRLAGYQKDWDNLSLVVERQTDYESEKDSLHEQKLYLESKHNILLKTMELLENAKNNLSTRYMSGMTSGFNKYINMISGTVDKIQIDADLNTKMESGGKLWKSDYFSSGYKDLVNICTRMALVDAMYQDENPFIILDDPFVNLDDNKIKNALDFVKILSDDRQVFYFVCHESRSVDVLK